MELHKSIGQIFDVIDKYSTSKGIIITDKATLFRRELNKISNDNQNICQGYVKSIIEYQKQHPNETTLSKHRQILDGILSNLNDVENPKYILSDSEFYQLEMLKIESKTTYTRLRVLENKTNNTTIRRYAVFDLVIVDNNLVIDNFKIEPAKVFYDLVTTDKYKCKKFLYNQDVISSAEDKIRLNQDSYDSDIKSYTFEDDIKIAIDIRKVGSDDNMNLLELSDLLVEYQC